MGSYAAVAAELRPFLLPGIHGAGGLSSSGVAAWTKGGSYSVAVAPAPGCFQVNPVLPNAGLAEAFACEVNRFSLAAFESMMRNERDMDVPRALAWPMITSYYAAYFSAHAICRLFGRSVSQLDSSVSASVSNVFSSYLGGGHNISTGLYAVSFDSAGASLQYVHNGGAGGSHELLWKSFLELLVFLRSSLLQSSPSTSEVQDVATYLDEVAARLKAKGANGGNWLSVLRNEVNYRQLYGVWYPYDVSASSADVVGRRIRSWLRERTDWTSTPGRNTELHCAADLASSLLSLLFWLLRDLGMRATGSRHFVHGSAFALLRQQAKAPSSRAIVGV